MATDFFEQQDIAQRRTGWLVTYFVLAVILIVLAVYAAFTAVVIATSKGGPDVPAVPLFDWGRLAGVTLVTSLIIALGSLYKIAALREGGAAVARLLGGKLIDPGTSDRAERRLLNVVEEMALASGTPVPPVYLLADEGAINAFAAGFGPGDAVIGITRGSLTYLNRDELQGVIGHEFSHILNGDMRLNLRLIGVLHGILLLALIGQLLMQVMRYSSSDSSRRSRSDDDDKGKGNIGLAIFLMGVALYAIGYLGVFFGRLIKSAVCRQREFLADASSVQFTRNPDGITGALKKIGGLAQGSHIESANAEQACHMFFGQGVSALSAALATHPPLPERIRRIDPTFDGIFPEPEPIVKVTDVEGPPDRRPGPAPGLGALFPVPTAMGGGMMAQGGAGRIPLNPLAVIATVGAPTQEHVAYATAFINALPTPLADATREPFGARAVIYALLLDADEAVRQVQLRLLDERAEPGTVPEVVKLFPLVGSLGEEGRIPLVDLALPALRQLSEAQYTTFRGLIDPLVKADRRVSLFEFALQRMLLRHLDRHFQKRPSPAIASGAPGTLLDDCGVLLSALAYLGQEAAEDSARAFAQGARRLQPSGRTIAMVTPDRCDLGAVDRVLGRLSAASPTVKKQVLDACVACIAADGSVTIAEGELLRAIADSLDCPMPPLMPGAVPARVEAEPLA